MANGIFGKRNFRPVKLISVGLTNNPNIPDSGRILSAGISRENEMLSATEKEARNLSIDLSKSVEKTKRCSAKIQEIEGKIKKSAVESRISRSRIQENKSVRNKLSEIADSAKKRAAQTGESYTKSFAYCKRFSGRK